MLLVCRRHVHCATHVRALTHTRLLDWGDIAVQVNGTRFAPYIGMAVMPGTTEIWDRAQQKLVPCDAQTCPYAIDGVNHAPYAAFGGT